MLNSVTKVEEWASSRGLDKKSVEMAKAQFLKMVEELGEVADCVSKQKSKEELSKEIGDLLVTIIIFAMQYNLRIDACLESAYEKIAMRTGKTVGGVFIKDGD